MSFVRAGRSVGLFVALWSLCAAGGAAEFKPAVCGPASLRLISGIPIIHVYGTPEQMGKQQGVLLGPAVRAVFKQYLERFLTLDGRNTSFRDTMVKLSREMEKSIPGHYVREMRALAKAAGATYEDVRLANTVFDLKRSIFCTTVVAVGKRSSDGQPIFARNLDFPTLGVAHKYSCVIVYHPAKGRSVASVTFPGLIGVLSGINDAGVTAATMEVRLRGSTTNAAPYAMVYRDALTGADSAADVVKSVTGRGRSSNNNLMICDAQGGAAVAELSLKRTAVRRPVDGLIYSTNHFQSKELGTPLFCWRLPRIRKALAGGKQLDTALAKTLLADVAYRRLTMQSMVLRPAARQFELAVGEPPAARHPFVLFKSSDLFPAPRKP